MTADELLKPRYCFIQRGAKGYGFNLHGEAPDQPGDANPRKIFYHVIKAVDSNSPAELGGLKQDDRLIGVNGHYVDHKPHNDVVALIKSSGDRTWLLVVDRETDDHFYNKLKRKVKFSDAIYGQQDKRGQPVNVNEIPMEEELVSEAENVYPGDVADDSVTNNDSVTNTSIEHQETPAAAAATLQFTVSEPVEETQPVAPPRSESPVPEARTENGYQQPTSPPDGDDPFGDINAARMKAKGQKHGAKNAGNWNNKWKDFNKL